MSEPPLTVMTPGQDGDTQKKTDSRPASAKSQRSTKSGSMKMGDIPPPLDDSKTNPASDLRNMRRIIAEDPEWSLATVPLLMELCITHVVANFENNSKILNDLLPKHKGKVLEKIATSLPLKVTASLVEDEGFWERSCLANWETCDVSHYGGSWKRMYFERNLERIIENFVPESTDPTELYETLELSTNYIKKLNIRQLLPPIKEVPKGPHEDDLSDGGDSDAGDGPEIDHFDFGPVLQQLPFIQEFHVTFGVRDCGMNFEWSLFQFTARDCLLLAKCITSLKTLKVFHLHRSKVDDDKVRVLISHILDHPSLVELDLSHNLISDRGARAVGKFINNHSQITTLNLSDNHIRTQGAQAIAHALTKNTTLTSLNLRLNRLGDEGGQAICRALMKNSTLVDVNMASNDLTEPMAAILSQVVLQNTTVKSIDLSSNRLGPDGGKQLQEGMEENQVITHMDLRLTECGKEAEYCINQILNRNREKEREKMLNGSIENSRA